MIYIIILLLIAPFIIAMVWNGLHGNDYKISYKAPPLTTTKGVLIRIIIFIYAFALLSTAGISRYDQAGQEGYNGTGRVVSLVVFFGLITALNIFMRNRRNK